MAGLAVSITSVTFDPSARPRTPRGARTSRQERFRALVDRDVRKGRRRPDYLLFSASCGAYNFSSTEAHPRGGRDYVEVYRTYRLVLFAAEATLISLATQRGTAVIACRTEMSRIHPLCPQRSGSWRIRDSALRRCVSQILRR